MTLEIGFLLVVLIAMIVLFLTEKLPIDLTAFIGLVVLIFTGYVTADQAFAGFASSAVITMLSIFIVGAALMNAGVADVAAEWIHKFVGGREIVLLITIMLTAGILSAFMNNIAATAVMMPAVASLARRAGLPPSKIFMPLSFGAIIGGTTTLVGTPPNILAGAVLAERGLKPFALFDFTPLGLILLAIGVVYMLTIGRKLLPSHELKKDEKGNELARLYGLDEHLFSIRIPSGSPFENKSLAETRLGGSLGVHIVAVLRGGERQLAPESSTKLLAGDELLVRGNQERLKELLEIQGIDIAATTARQLDVRQRGVSGVRLRIAKDSELGGLTLRESNFRGKFGLAVMAVERGSDVWTKKVGDIQLLEGDFLYGIGTSGKVADLSEYASTFEVERTGVDALQDLIDVPLLVLRLPEDSALVGRTIAESRLSEVMGVMIVGFLRGESVRWSTAPGDILEAGDELIVSGEESKLRKLLEIGNVELESQVSVPSLESEEVGVVEATIAPRSNLAGKTLAEVNFRERMGLNVLAVWREGEPVRDGLANLSLRIGDGLLLHGKRRQLATLASDEDLVILSEITHTEPNLKKAPYALGGLVLMIVLVVSGYQPIQVAAFAAATFVILAGALSMKEAYRAIEWKAIFLVAAVLPVGAAMESSGAATLMAQSVVTYAGNLGPYVVLASLIVLSSVLSQGLDGAPAVVLLAPVVLSTAAGLDISPYPLMMGVALAASAAFMTPFSHKANLLVMGAGGYKSWDYIRVGTPLTVVILVALVIFVPVFFPF